MVPIWRAKELLLPLVELKIASSEPVVLRPAMGRRGRVMGAHVAFADLLIYMKALFGERLQLSGPSVASHGKTWARPGR
jgi:hypothetical protein